MASDQSQDVRRIAIGSSDNSEDFVNSCTALYVSADTNCYINFDNPATTSSFFIPANQFCHMERLSFSRIHVIGTSGNLYIIGTRT